MYNKIVFLHIKRVLRNVLLLSGIGLIISIAYLIPDVFTLSTIMKGSKSISISNINCDTSKLCYVNISGDNIYDMNLKHAGFNDGEYETDGRYYALKKENKIIIVLLPIDKEPNTVVSGFLRKLKPDKAGEAAALKSVQAADNSENYAVVPYVLNGLIYSSFNMVLIVFFIIVFIVSLVAFIICLIQWFKPDKNRIYARLKMYGVPYKVIEDIEIDAKNSEPLKVGNTTIYNNYLINKTFFSVNIIKCNELIWVYKNIIKRRVNYIPMGKDYNVMFCYNNRNLLSIREGKKNVDSIIKELAERYPWVIYGYSHEIDSLWSNDFNQLLDLIRLRKSKFN